MTSKRMSISSLLSNDPPPTPTRGEPPTPPIPTPTQQHPHDLPPKPSQREIYHVPQYPENYDTPPSTAPPNVPGPQRHYQPPSSAHADHRQTPRPPSNIQWHPSERPPERSQEYMHPTVHRQAPRIAPEETGSYPLSSYSPHSPEYPPGQRTWHQYAGPGVSPPEERWRSHGAGPGSVGGDSREVAPSMQPGQIRAGHPMSMGQAALPPPQLRREAVQLSREPPQSQSHQAQYSRHPPEPAPPPRPQSYPHGSQEPRRSQQIAHPVSPSMSISPHPAQSPYTRQEIRPSPLSESSHRTAEYTSREYPPPPSRMSDVYTRQSQAYQVEPPMVRSTGPSPPVSQRQMVHSPMVDSPPTQQFAHTAPPPAHPPSSQRLPPLAQQSRHYPTGIGSPQTSPPIASKSPTFILPQGPVRQSTADIPPSRYGEGGAPLPRISEYEQIRPPLSRTSESEHRRPPSSRASDTEARRPSSSRSYTVDISRPSSSRSADSPRPSSSRAMESPHALLSRPSSSRAPDFSMPPPPQVESPRSSLARLERPSSSRTMEQRSAPPPPSPHDVESFRSPHHESVDRFRMAREMGISASNSPQIRQPGATSPQFIMPSPSSAIPTVAGFPSPPEARSRPPSSRSMEVNVQPPDHSGHASRSPAMPFPPSPSVRQPDMTPPQQFAYHPGDRGGSLQEIALPPSHIPPHSKPPSSRRSSGSGETRQRLDRVEATPTPSHPRTSFIVGSMQISPQATAPTAPAMPTQPIPSPHESTPSYPSSISLQPVNVPPASVKASESPSPVYVRVPGPPSPVSARSSLPSPVSARSTPASQAAVPSRTVPLSPVSARPPSLSPVSARPPPVSPVSARPPPVSPVSARPLPLSPVTVTRQAIPPSPVMERPVASPSVPAPPRPLSTRTVPHLPPVPMEDVQPTSEPQIPAEVLQVEVTPVQPAARPVEVTMNDTVERVGERQVQDGEATSGTDVFMQVVPTEVKDNAPRSIPEQVEVREAAAIGSGQKRKPDEVAFEDELLSLVDDGGSAPAQPPQPTPESVPVLTTSRKTPASGANTPVKSTKMKGKATKSSKAKTGRQDSAAPSPPQTSKQPARKPKGPAGTGTRRKATAARARSLSVKPAEATPVPEEETPLQDDKLYCICERPYDEERVMIACDRCDEWYHPACVGMPEQEIDLVDQFICSKCSKKDPSLHTTYKVRCHRGTHHIAAYDDLPPCWKPARGLCSKYCSDRCGISHMRAKVAQSKVDPTKLWPVLKSARKREGVTIEHTRRGKKIKSEKGIAKVEALDVMDVDEKPLKKGAPKTLDGALKAQRVVDQRELDALKQKLADNLREQEKIDLALHRCELRRRLLDLSGERSDQQRFCGWDARFEMGDPEWDDWVHTSEAATALKGDDMLFGRENINEMPWICRGARDCPRHGNWQRLRDEEIQSEINAKKASRKVMQEREKTLLRRMKVLDPTVNTEVERAPMKRHSIFQ